MKWKILSSEYLSRHKYFTARQDKCETPEGKIIDEYFVVELPTTVCAVAFTEEGEVLMVKQYRHPIKETILEITGGFVDEGETPEEVLEGAAFTIPVSSLFTDNPDRDSKLKEFFFGTLKNSELLAGVINFREGKCYMTLTMNDVTKEIVTEYTFENNLFTLTSTLNLVEFGGEKAIAALNAVCLDLHKGKDGVSKTWELVDIKGSVLFENNKPVL